MRRSITPSELAPLADLLKQVPAVKGPGLGPDGNIPGGYYTDRRWWLVFQIKTDDPLAWHVLRRLAEVLNDYSGPRTEDLFPTVLKPIVPGGPASVWWSLESTRPDLAVADVIERMKSRLPQPIDDSSRWL
jgi:hypothetical protein